MADYRTQTVVQPEIPAKDLTALEYFILSQMFTMDETPDGGKLYLYADEGIQECFDVRAADLQIAVDQSNEKDCALIRFCAAALMLNTAVGAPIISLDFTGVGTGYVQIFQDIIAHSDTVEYVTLESAHTCSKMRSDGFGGSAEIITAQDYHYVNTSEWLTNTEGEIGLTS